MNAVAAMGKTGGDNLGHGGEASGEFGYRNRSVEFRRARRHTRLVQTLKITFPALAAAIFSLYIIPPFLRVSIDGGRGTASVKSITFEKGALKMINPRVTGVNDQQGVYDLTADSATQASRGADVMLLDKVKGKLVSADGKVSTLTAPNALYNNRTEEMTFNNGATVKQGPGLTAIFQTATAYMKQNLVVSNTPVVVHLNESTINAEKMTLYSSEGRVIFEGNVRTHVERQPVAENAEAQQSGPALETAGAPQGPSGWQTSAD